MSDNQREKNSQKLARLIEVLESTGMDNKGFAKKIDISESYLSEILSGVKGVPRTMASRLHRSLDINIEWFNDGVGFRKDSINAQYKEGEITLREAVEEDNSHIDLANSSRVPMYDGDVTASIVSSFNDIRESPSYFVDFKPFNDCTALFRVYGDSMYPKYASGEIIAVKQVFNLNTILWGEAYLVVTDSEADNLRTVKTVHPAEDADYIILKASNPNFRGETPVKKKSIIAIFLVKGKTRIEHL